MNTSSASTTSAETKEPTTGARKAESVVRAPAGVLDVLAGVVLLGVFGLYGWHAMQLPGPMNPNGIGVGEFPVIIAVVSLVAVALMLGVGVIKCVRRSAHPVVTTSRHACSTSMRPARILPTSPCPWTQWKRSSITVRIHSAW